MDAGLIERIETGAGRGASALFAAAVGYAAYGLFAAIGLEPQLGLAAAGAGALAYLPCSRMLRVSGDRSARFVLPDFALCDFEFAEAPDELLLTDRVASAEELLLTDRVASADELLLTDSDRVDTGAKPADQGPLVLDDILAELGPDARVVRLFDRKAMPTSRPTPGQLQSRIADHLGDGASLSAPSDASQALSAALAELRRSLR
ncbi:MAG: hypothetical protein ABI853_04120 [Sphingomicrobium sp.]